MHLAWPGRADRREQVVPRQAGVGILEFLAILGEEDGSCPRSIADAENVALL